MTMLRESINSVELISTDYSSEQPAAKPEAKTPAPAQSMSEKSDPELIDMVRKGQKRAFDVLTSRHQQMVTSILLRMMDLPDAQDVAQEAFIKAYKSLDSFRGDSQFATWLYRIATNTAMNHLKMRKRRPPTVHLDALDNDKSMHCHSVVDHNTPEAQVIADELERLLTRRLNRLTPDLRDAITSYELDGMSYQEIADHMQCPVGTVRSRISRSREIIDADLRANGFEPMSQRYHRQGESGDAGA